MANITTAGTESLLEAEDIHGNVSGDTYPDEPAVSNGDALEDDEGEESDEYDVEEEQQAAEGEDDEYEYEEEEGGYEDEDEQGTIQSNGKANLTALLLGDPNSTVGNGDDDDYDDDEGEYDEDEDANAEDEPAPISPSTSKKRSIDDLEEADANEAKKAKA